MSSAAATAPATAAATAAATEPAKGPAAETSPEPVTVIDTGVGNLGNLRRALARVGAAAAVSSEPEVVAASRCLVLPGVGAFAPPRDALRGELEAALRSALDGGAWLLGVCVGYQLLFESSEEFGDTDGLALLPGRVGRLPGSVPLPHIGWNRLQVAAAALGGSGTGGSGAQGDNGSGDAGPGVASHREAAGEAAGLLAGLPAESWVYFVHSYAPRQVPEELVLARTLHGRPFAAAAGRGRVMGTQFHPEKSGALGLAVLRNFLRLAGAVPAAAPPAAATLVREVD